MVTALTNKFGPEKSRVSDISTPPKKRTKNFLTFYSLGDHPLASSPTSQAAVRRLHLVTRLHLHLQ